MKKFVSAVFTAVLAVVTSMSVFAESSPFDVKDYSDFFDDEELSEVIYQAREDKSTFDAFVSDTPAVAAFNTEARSTDEYEAYKTHIVGTPYFLDELKEGVLFGEEVSSEYVWYISSLESTVMIDNDNGQWRVYGSSEMLPGALEDGVYNDVPRYDIINSAVEKIREKDLSEIKTIVSISDVADTYTTYVCIFTDNIYVVPFGARPDFTGLEYGGVYTPAEARDILAQRGYFDSPQLDENGATMIGGYGGVEKTTGATKTAVEDASIKARAYFPILPIVVIPAAVIALGVSIMFFVWNRSSKRSR